MTSVLELLALTSIVRARVLVLWNNLVTSRNPYIYIGLLIIWKFIVGNNLMVMYFVTGDVFAAHYLFDEIPRLNSILEFDYLSKVC